MLLKGELAQSNKVDFDDVQTPCVTVLLF